MVRRADVYQFFTELEGRTRIKEARNIFFPSVDIVLVDDKMGVTVGVWLCRQAHLHGTAKLYSYSSITPLNLCCCCCC